MTEPYDSKLFLSPLGFAALSGFCVLAVSMSPLCLFSSVVWSPFGVSLRTTLGALIGHYWFNFYVSKTRVGGKLLSQKSSSADSLLLRIGSHSSLINPVTRNMHKN